MQTQNTVTENLLSIWYYAKEELKKGISNKSNSREKLGYLGKV